MLKVLAIAAMAALLGGCAELAAFLPDGPKDMEVRFKPVMACSEFLDRVDPAGSMSTDQQRAALRACEDLQKGATVRPGALLGMPQ